MSSGKITYDDLFDKDLMKRLADLKVQIAGIKSDMTGLKGSLPRSGNKSGDIEKLNAVQKERIRLQEKMNRLEDDEARVNEEMKIQLQQRLKQQKDEIKLNQAKEGSMERLSIDLKKLKKEYRELSEAERQNVNQGGKLLKQIQQQDKKIKSLDKTLGDHQRNVGNYSGGVMEAANNMGMFGGKLGRASQMFGNLKGGLKTARAGFVSLKAAIISTGIGALLIALTSLVTYFTKTTKGARMISSVMAGIGGVIDVLVDKLATLGELFVGVVQNPLKYFSILKDYITDRIVPIFVSLGKIISNAITFNWSELGDNVDEFSDNFKAVQEDWQTLANKNAEAFKGMFNTAKEAYTANAQLEKDRQKLKDDERELGVELAKNKKLYQDLLLISRDETVSFDERQKALRRANEIELSNLEESTKLAEEKLRIAKEQAEWNAKNGRTQEADLEAIAEAETALFEMQAQNAARRREIVNRQIELDNKRSAAVKKAAKDEADFQKFIEEDLLSFEEEINKEIEEENKRLNDALIQQQIEKGDKSRELMEKEMGEVQRLADSYRAAGISIGEAFGEMLGSQEKSFKDFLKEMVIMLLSALEKQLMIYQAQAAAKSLATKGIPAGLIEGALIAGIIKAGFTAAKAAVMQFERGEVDIAGPRHSQGGIAAEIEGGESVINRTGTANARNTLKLINEGKLGDAHILPALAMSAVRVPNVNVNSDFAEMVKRQDKTNDLLKKFKFMSADGRKVMDINGNVINYV